MRKVLLIALVLFFVAHISWGQGCAICAKTATALGTKGAKGLNGGILYLAMLPLTLMGGLTLVWLRHNKKVE